MNTSLRLLTAALTLAAASLLGTAAAQAQTVITSLPYTITAKGLYVLNGDLNSSQTSGSLIQVNASNVTIDFQGHYISGPAANTSQNTFGVYANERSNITVKNGTIAYCQYGVYLTGNGGSATINVNHQIDNMRLTYCYTGGVFVSHAPASRVTNCQVSQGGYTGASVAYGIDINGAGATVQGNVVSVITATNSYGIYAETGNFIRQNSVSNTKYGVYGGKYQDTLTANCTVAYTNGTDAGGNN